MQGRRQYGSSVWTYELMSLCDGCRPSNRKSWMVLLRTSMGRAGLFEMPMMAGEPGTECARRPSACRGAGCLGSPSGLEGVLAGISTGKAGREQPPTVMWLIIFSTASIATPPVDGAAGIVLTLDLDIAGSAGFMAGRDPFGAILYQEIRKCSGGCLDVLAENRKQFLRLKRLDG